SGRATRNTSLLKQAVFSSFLLLTVGKCAGQSLRPSRNCPPVTRPCPTALGGLPFVGGQPENLERSLRQGAAMSHPSHRSSVSAAFHSWWSALAARWRHWGCAGRACAGCAEREPRARG